MKAQIVLCLWNVATSFLFLENNFPAFRKEGGVFEKKLHKLKFENPNKLIIIKDLSFQVDRKTLKNLIEKFWSLLKNETLPKNLLEL